MSVRTNLATAEPVVVRGVATTLVGALITLGVEFGLPISEGQTLAIQALVVAALAAYYLVSTRAKVTPSALVIAQENTDGLTIAGEASPIPDGTPVVVKTLEAEEADQHQWGR